MTTGRDALDRLADAFAAVRTLPPAERETAIARHAAGDDAFAAELRALLAHDGDDGPLAEPVGLDLQAGSAAPRAERIGPYRLVRVLGEGGMGIVHLAEQDSPRRLVALKMLRPGLVSRSLARRFAQESELLGRLRHPGIAAVHEAGAIDLGFGPQPYFAMEYVEGMPLVEHAERAGLDRTARLRLVVEIAHALQHAHDRGIVHRDLKPANILVDAQGRPRILDFGVARSLDADARLTTLRTDVGQLVGTIPYMSPEQLDGGPTIDARADVYALGVLTYELLAGRLPHDVADRPVVEAIARLRHDEPTTLASANPACRGDLDVIVGKALERDPDRRYPSAVALARDLERFLGDEPIEARAPSVIYRSRKFVRRHRTLVAATAAVFLVLAAATIVAARLAVIADARRRDASALAQQRAREAVVARIVAAGADLESSGSLSAQARLDALPDDAASRWEVRHLRARLDGSLGLTSFGARGTLRAEPLADGTIVAVRRDGAVVAGAGGAGGADGAAIDWREVTRIDGAPSESVPLPDGRLVVATASGELRAVDPRTGATAWHQAPGGRVRALATDAAGARLAATFNRPGVLLLDARDGAERGRLSIIPIPTLLAFADEDRTLLAYADRGGLRAFDVATGAAGRAYPGHRARVSALAVSPDGARIASADAEGTVLVRTRDDGEPQLAVVVPGAPTYVYDLAFSPDGRTIAAATGIGTVVAWDLEDARPRPRVVHLPARRVDAVRWSAATPERVHAVSLVDGVFALDAQSLAPPPPLPMLTRAVPVLDGQVVALAGGDGTVRLVCLRTGAELPSVRAARTLLRTIDVAADGRTIVVADQDGVVHRATLGADDAAPWPIDARAVGAALALLRGDRLAVAIEGDRVRIAARDGGVVADLAVGERGAAALAAAPDDDRFVTGGRDGRVRLWSADGADLGTLAHADGSVTALAWLGPDAVAIGGDDGLLRVVDLPARTERWRVAAHPTVINDLAVSPDRARLATASTDRTVRLFDAETGDEVLVLRDVAAAMHGLAFSADGAVLAGTALDGSLHLWRTTSERTVAAHRRLRAALLAGAPLPDDADATAAASFGAHLLQLQTPPR